MTDPTPESGSSFNYGWVMVFVAFMLNTLAFGVLASVTVFLTPLEAEFGWSRGGLSFGYSAVTLATAFSALGWATLADKYGCRKLAPIGAAAMVLALTALSWVDNIYEFYAYYLLYGALGHAALSGPLYANVGLWFERNVGLAMGITFAGGAVGQGLIPVIARALIDAFGWQDAYFYLGVGYLVLSVPLLLLVRDSARRTDPRSANAPTMRGGHAVPIPPKTAVIWVASAVMFCCIAMSVPVVHLVPLLIDRNVAADQAVMVLFALMISGALGRVLAGKMTDMIGALETYILMSLAQTLVIFSFPHIPSLMVTLAVAIFFGFSFSGVMASFIILMRHLVPMNVLARSMAFVSLSGWIGMGLGAWQGGVWFDVTGNYVLSFAIGSAAGIVNLAILFSFRWSLNSKLQPA